MRLTLAILGVFVLISLEYATARPLDDENNVKEGDDAAAADKRDKIVPKDNAKKDGPKAPKAKADKDKPGQQREVTTAATTVATTLATTKAPTVTGTKKVEVTGPTKATVTSAVVATKPTEAAKTTAGATTVSKVTDPTTAPVTTPAVTTPQPEGTTPTQSVKRTPVPVPEEGGDGDVENSANNTKNMEGTTFHVAIRLTTLAYSDDLQIAVNPVYEKTKQLVITALEKVYQNDPTYKQTVIIGFSDSANPKKVVEEEKEKAQVRSVTNPPGVIVEFYIRFHTSDTHLRKLSTVIATGLLDTHVVSKKFVRAYPAEPKGRVCTPDCKVQCYSYCDQGCCNVHTFIPISLAGAAPAAAAAPVAAAPMPAPAPAPVAAPAPAPAYQPPVQPAPYPNYAPMPPPAAAAAQCPPICNTYCAPQCPNDCCSSYASHPVQYPAAYPPPAQQYQPAAAYPAPYAAPYPAPMPAAYPAPYPAPAQAGCGFRGCGK